jgi:hypothetical protein
MIVRDQTRELLNDRSWPSLKDAIVTCIRKTEENREAFVRIDDIVKAILSEVSMIFLRPVISLLPIIRSVCNNLVDAIACVVLDFPQSLRGTRKRSWLRHYATNRKVAGSSPDEMDFFQLT